jgi:hypothetical protein
MADPDRVLREALTLRPADKAELIDKLLSPSICEQPLRVEVPCGIPLALATEELDRLPCKGYLASRLGEGLGHGSLREPQDSGFAMKMRQSSLFKLWTKFWMGLLIVGVLSPGAVWCHESDGDVALEYGLGCSKDFHSQPMGAGATVTRSDESCGCWVDAPVFTLGPTSGLSRYELSGSLLAVPIALIESASSQIFNVPSLKALLLNTYQTDLTLSTVRSTVLLS